MTQFNSFSTIVQQIEKKILSRIRIFNQVHVQIMNRNNDLRHQIEIVNKLENGKYIYINFKYL